LREALEVKSRLSRGMICLLLLLWLPSVLLTNIGYFHYVGSWRIYNGLGAIFVAVLLLNACGLSLAAMRLRSGS
jgi:hypothetical protein